MTPPPVKIDMRFQPRVHYQRAICRGVIEHFSAHRPGWVWRDLRGPPDGIVGYLRARAEDLADLPEGVPCVTVADDLGVPGAAIVVPDNFGVGQLAAEHLYGLGLRQFLAVSFAGSHSAANRVAGFSDWLGEAGCTPAVETIQSLGDRGLPAGPAGEPIGVFCYDDAQALRLQPHLTDRGLRCPDDVVLLGVNNDDLNCWLMQPPLSSIDLNLQAVGRTAGAVLDAMIQGQRPESRRLTIEPNGVVARASTDRLVVADPVVRAALEVIRREALAGLTVEALLARLPVSRRKLEIACREAIGRSPYAEIQRIRFAHACMLLRETELTMAEVAGRIGFANPRHFATAFGKHHGQSPSAYRRTSRRGREAPRR